MKKQRRHRGGHRYIHSTRQQTFYGPEENTEDQQEQQQ